MSLSQLLDYRNTCILFLPILVYKRRYSYLTCNYATVYKSLRGDDALEGTIGKDLYTDNELYWIKGIRFDSIDSIL